MGKPTIELWGYEHPWGRRSILIDGIVTEEILNFLRNLKRFQILGVRVTAAKNVKSPPLSFFVAAVTPASPRQCGICNDSLLLHITD